MKKNLLFVLTMLCAFSLFTACSSDNKEDFQGAYSAENLDLTYGGSKMVGKQAVFSTTDGKTGEIILSGGSLTDLIGALTSKSDAQPSLSLALPGVIPGQTSTTITGIALTGSEGYYSFSGQTTAGTTSVTYSGNVTPSVLTLNLDVTVPSNTIQGTWTVNTTNPISAKWESTAAFDISLGTATVTMKPEDILQMIFSLPVKDGKTVSELLCAVLKSVTFDTDGNITAMYSPKTAIASPVYVTSPSNLVQYTADGTALKIFLDVNAIMAATTKSETKALAITTLLPDLMTLLPMLSSGFPLTYTVNGSSMTLMLDSAFGIQVIQLVAKIISDEDVLNSIVESLGALPATVKPMIEAAIKQFPTVAAGTTTFQVGINFTK